MRHLPGPPPTSCITCQRRKKKCDRVHPFCARCTKGGFECLGYNSEQLAQSSSSPLSPTYSLDGSLSSSDKHRAQHPKYARLSSRTHPDRIQRHKSSSSSSESPLPSPPTPSRPFLVQLSTSVPQAYLSASYHLGLISQPHELQSTSCSNSVLERETNADHSTGEEEWPEPDSHPETWMTLVQQRQQSVSSASSADAVHCLPPRFVPNPLVSGLTIRFIMSQYEPLFEMMFFKPIKSHIKLVRGKFISRIISSSLTHMSMLLGANMFQCLKQGGHASARRFVPWIDRCYRLCVTSKHDVVFEDFVGRLSGALELTFLKFIVADANSGRALMRRIAPTFMQIACADPSLWPHDPSSSGISLAHVLVSGHNELTRFVFIDMVSSLTLGVTPLIEYDTSHPVIRTCEVHPLEWVHGCPLEFAFAILKINTWAAQNATGRTAPAEIWEEIEATAWAWTPRCDYGPDHESRRIMARFAGQEGWRHAVLIYLYMRMCGANSHDARVQASVQQISRLCGVVSPSLSIGLHFVVPLLLAAICTPSEAQRNRLRAAIAEPGENKIWLLQTVQLAFVLDHLWHGAAANGAAVTWDDYVSSRRAVVPIDI